jgi:hypothetical protein
MDESTVRTRASSAAIEKCPDNFAVAEHYSGEWVVPAALGRAHLAIRKGSTVRTACGATLPVDHISNGRRPECPTRPEQ